MRVIYFYLILFLFSTYSVLFSSFHDIDTCGGKQLHIVLYINIIYIYILKPSAGRETIIYAKAVNFHVPYNVRLLALDPNNDNERFFDGDTRMQLRIERY